MSLNHQGTWVIVTDSSTCKIFNYCKKPSDLTLIKEVDHPENKLRDIDLTSDKPGHYTASNGAQGAYTQTTDPKEVKIDNFAREIAKELEVGRNNHSYEKLILIALPRMNGLLSQHINKHVKDLISHTIEKDVLHLSNPKLLEFLKENTQYSNE